MRKQAGFIKTLSGKNVSEAGAAANRAKEKVELATKVLNNKTNFINNVLDGEKYIALKPYQDRVDRGGILSPISKMRYNAISKNINKKNEIKKAEFLKDYADDLSNAQGNYDIAANELMRQKRNTFNTRLLTGSAGSGTLAFGGSKLKDRYSDEYYVEPKYPEFDESITLTASDYSTFFEKYASESVEKIAFEALKKVVSGAKGIPSKFENKYDLGRPQGLANNIKDIATFGGYRRGERALNYAKAERNSLGEHIKFDVSDFPEDTQRKLNNLRENSMKVQKDYDRYRESVQNLKNLSSDWKYKNEIGDSMDYNKMQPLNVIEQFKKNNPKAVKNFEEKFKRPMESEDIYKAISNKKLADVAIEKGKTQRLYDAVVAEQAPVDERLSQIRKTRDNELAKSLGLYAVPTAAIGTGIYSLKNKQDN